MRISPLLMITAAPRALGYAPRTIMRGSGMRGDTPGTINTIMHSRLTRPVFGRAQTLMTATTVNQLRGFTTRGGASDLPQYSPGAPTFAVVPPGTCQFNDEFVPCKLTKIQRCSSDTSVYSFALPDPSKPLDLPTCGCVLVAGGADEEGNPFIRPYTPVSTNALVGEVDLMVKEYPGGNLSKVFGELKVGDELAFKHIIFNVKKQYSEFPKGAGRTIAMLVGGTGITPMIQALHAILGNPDDDTKVVMLYGSRSSSDILASETMDAWAASSKQLTVKNVLSAEPADSAYDGLRGFIDADLIKSSFPPPEEDPLIFVCGPPPMYNALCGAREDEELSGVLKELGYTKEQVYKF